MIITNSLGSNFAASDRRVALKLLLEPWKWRSGTEQDRLIEAIHERSDLRVELFLKGRHAIYEALRQLHVGSADEVILQAFTCIAVVQPILNLGATPVYVDVERRSLNPTFLQIKATVTERTKAVILQHTLGYVNSETDNIVEWCQRRNIAVIQDLAHSFGAPLLRNIFRDNAPKGTSFIVLSFSQDKVIDGVSGGALLSQTTAIFAKTPDDPLRNKVSRRSFIFRSLLYPLISSLIRSTYSVFIGKLIHFAAKNFELLPSPLDAPSKPAPLPNALAALVLNQINRLDQVINHRSKIAAVYDQIIDQRFKLVTPQDIKNGANLRYPMRVDNRDELEEKLKPHGFFLLDHWYDAPVAPARSDYSKAQYTFSSCPNAEELSRHIFNLPTHISINERQAVKLANLVNKYADKL